jgi:hypothetical protein
MDSILYALPSGTTGPHFETAARLIPSAFATPAGVLKYLMAAPVFMGAHVNHSFHLKATAVYDSGVNLGFHEHPS